MGNILISIIIDYSYFAEASGTQPNNDIDYAISILAMLLIKYSIIPLMF